MKSPLPSLDLGPGPRWDGGSTPAPKPGWHGQEPPKQDEREKKGRLSSGKSAEWLQALGMIVNGFTETDDFIYAIYNALPWNLRRWKGRDGVWRDRDANTWSRYQRILQYASSISVKEAVENLKKNQEIDAIGGRIGRIGRHAVQNNAYYRGARGLQAGQNFTKEIWDDLLLEMRRAEEKKAKPRDYYKYQPVDKDGNVIPLAYLQPDQRGLMTREGYVDSPFWTLPPGYSWKRVLVKGSKQVIPWLQRTYNKRVRAGPGSIAYWQKQTNGVSLVRRKYYRRVNQTV